MHVPMQLGQPGHAANKLHSGMWTRQWRARRCRAAGATLAASKQPDKGFFSEVDPSVEVMPVRSGLGKVDVTKKGGRWEPEFIWQTNWAEALDREEAERERDEAEAKAAANGSATAPQQLGVRGAGADSGKGYLRLGSKIDLNDMSLDLSEQLRARKKSGAQASSASSSRTSSQQQRRRSTAPQYASVTVTRVEQRAWERGSGYAKRVVPIAPTNEVDEAMQAEILASERARYEQLKAELQAWAAGLTVVCLGATFAFYGRDVAASYGLGALGGLLYLRLLNRSVDAVAGGGMGGALGQPRLLIPVILALGYNRYNQLVAAETGLTLQLLPMLLGFFTYKGAVIARQSLELFGDLTAPYRSSNDQQQGGQGEGSSTAADVQSVDRDFRRKVLRG